MLGAIVGAQPTPLSATLAEQRARQQDRDHRIVQRGTPSNGTSMLMSIMAKEIGTAPRQRLQQTHTGQSRNQLAPNSPLQSGQLTFVLHGILRTLKLNSQPTLMCWLGGT